MSGRDKKKKNSSQVQGQALLKTIREWPSDLYNIQAIIKLVQDKLRADPNNTVLMDALAELFVYYCFFFLMHTLFLWLDCSFVTECRFIYDKQYDKALLILLKLKRGNVFDLIRKV